MNRPPCYGSCQPLISYAGSRFNSFAWWTTTLSGAWRIRTSCLLRPSVYVSAELLVQSQAIYHVELVGSARKDRKWQALAGQGYAVDFNVDWDAQQATCSQRHTSQSCINTLENGQPRVFIKFSRRRHVSQALP
jgi:hypothetical protein